MKTIALFFALLSALGCALALQVHTSALMGSEPNLPFDPMALHGAIFVVFIPALFLAFFLKVGPEQTATLRGFSGHWMLFFAVALAIHYAYWRAGPNLGPVSCPNGHPVAPDAPYCRRCGSSLSDPTDPTLDRSDG